MSRRQARGKVKWKKGPGGSRQLVTVRKGLVDFDKTRKKAESLGIILRGGDADESPECYKRLDDVLRYQGETIRVLHRLRPIAVAMARPDIHHHYRD